MRDQRIYLAGGSILEDRSRLYEVEKPLLAGANAIAYCGTARARDSPFEKHSVLIKEFYPWEPNHRACRRENADLDWMPDMETWRERERRRFLLSCQTEFRENVSIIVQHNTLYAVTDYSGGNSLESLLYESGDVFLPLAVILRRMLAVLAALERIHERGCLHLDIRPATILLTDETGEERISLTSVNGIHPLAMPEEGTDVFFGPELGYAAPELRAGRLSRLCQATDLYALTAVLYRCVTGKALSLSDASQACVRLPRILGVTDREVEAALQRIFRRGLSFLPKKRYHHCDELRKELLVLRRLVQ